MESKPLVIHDLSRPCPIVAAGSHAYLVLMMKSMQNPVERPKTLGHKGSIAYWHGIGVDVVVVQRAGGAPVHMQNTMAPSAQISTATVYASR